MSTLAIIGGTGLARMDGLSIERREMVKTPYGAPSCPLVFGTLNGQSIVFLARHGSAERIPPHRINYCANLWALQSVGVRHVIATSVVSGIEPACTTGALVIPDQLIDYTHGRESSYSDSSAEAWQHVDFTEPYSAPLREALIDSARGVAGVTLVEDGCYAAVQGPRFESAAEIRRLARDGNTVVGMTGMPEAVLARELGLGYACCAVVVMPAPGSAHGKLDLEAMSRATASGMASVRGVLGALSWQR